MQFKSTTMLLLGLALTSYTSAMPSTGQGTSGGAGASSSAGQGTTSSPGAGAGRGAGTGATGGVSFPRGDGMVHPAQRGTQPAGSYSYTTPRWQNQVNDLSAQGRGPPGGVSGGRAWNNGQGSSQGGSSQGGGR
ncbi:Hypothetical protein D9617_7g030230 [Elsinoe fawcettii]|nr:Hypothetical protein D9617_7g030230 [Elsinoe fawcettii]